MLTLWLEETKMVKVMVFLVESKTNVSGCTAMVMPIGGSMTALYFEFTGPTFVTVLIMVVEFLRDGIVMEGRFMSSMDGCFVGQEIGSSVKWEMLGLL